MQIAENTPLLSLPDHTQLPESDGTFVKNFQEHPQSILLTTSIQPLLDTRHPDGHYAIGQDCGIYWRLTEPPEQGAEAPDWFYVANVPPLVDGQLRRSYVMWKEIIAPLIAIEFVSGDGSEERDQTSPFSNDAAKAGKFWVYEQAIRIPFYAIFMAKDAALEVYELLADRYQPCRPNQEGRYPIPPLGVELGIWQGKFMSDRVLPWLRWWDSKGALLPTGNERAEQERQRAEREEQRAEQERQRAERGEQRAEQERQRAEREEQRAEQERQARLDAVGRLRSMNLTPEQIAAALSLPIEDVR